MHRVRSIVLLAISTLGLAACAGGGDAAQSRQASVAAALAPSETELVQQVPGFGGFFLDAGGAPAVYLVPGAARAPAEAAFEEFLGARGLPASALRVLEARFPWPQLEHWKQEATLAAFAIDGCVFVDNDETINRIRVGVADRRAMGAVRAALAAARIPDDAVVVEETQPIVQVATLQNVVDRPVRAGVQINFPGYLCTLGFNATTPGGQASFVTASHCTSKQGGVESTPYWQPLESVAPAQIATEVDDPAYSKFPGCPRGRICRYSDAARAAYLDPANQALGLIAATAGPNGGSLDITGSFSITGDDATNAVQVNATVNKIGRTTGWTSGVVTQKCVDTGVQGSRIVQLCQNFVAARVAGGDSGSDVFAIAADGVTLEGVLWGGSSSGDLFVYSPLQNVIQELGPLTTH